MENIEGNYLIHVVGGGLAGCEAAWQCLRAGHRVILHEMRPLKTTPAHKTSSLAELVCSNSLKSTNENSASGLLKYEMKELDSLLLKAAEHSKVPAGQALSVDKILFSQYVTRTLEQQKGFQKITEEITMLPTVDELKNKKEYWIITTGPLSSEGILEAIIKICNINPEQLFFYDAIAPIIASQSIDYSHCFKADRYSDDGDYLNIPLNKEEYDLFYNAILNAEKVKLREFEKEKYFEGCLPIEVMAERGRDTLRFGPMKPVGLVDPRTGKRPWANIQLRIENKEQTMFNMVGFQTKMTYSEQKKVFSILPALKNAEFHRFGSIHRNTYFNSPQILSSDLSFKSSPNIFLAGQITGVEGYLESASMGLLAGLFASQKATTAQTKIVPKTTMIGSLLAHVTQDNPNIKRFDPMNANMGILEVELEYQDKKKLKKEDKYKQKCLIAKTAIKNYCNSIQS